MMDTKCSYCHTEMHSFNMQSKRHTELIKIVTSFCVWPVWDLASVFVYCCCSSLMNSSWSREGNVTHNIPCYWYPIAKGRDKEKKIRGVFRASQLQLRNLKKSSIIWWGLIVTKLKVVMGKKGKREEEIGIKTPAAEGWSLSKAACLQMNVFPSCNFAVRMQRTLNVVCVRARVCVRQGCRWLFHPTHSDYEKKCFSLSFLHIYIFAHTDSLLFSENSALTIPDLQGCAGSQVPRLWVGTLQHL